MIMTRTIEFFFDINSPYTYLASERIDTLGQRINTSVRCCPFFLGGVHKITGNIGPGLQDYKLPYLKKELERLA